MKSLIYIFICTLIITVSCKEDVGTINPLYSDGSGPSNVSKVRVENKPGKAILRYEIPADVDFSYVKARYEIRPGVFRETKSSKTNDSLVVDGFGESKDYKVEIQAYDLGNNSSDVHEITVHPETPPLVDFVKNIGLFDDFGGMRIVLENPTETDFKILVAEKASNSDLEIAVTSIYTKAKNMTYNIRGYEPSPVTFVFTIEDKFGNVAKPIVKDFLPLEEVKLDRTKFREVKGYENDTKILGTGRGVPEIFNGVFGDDAWHSAGSESLPMAATFDLGRKSKINRFKFYHRTSSPTFIFNHYNIKNFELYGSNDPTSDWSTWQLLGSFEITKPSGLPLGTNSDEDAAVSNSGFEFNIPADAPDTRYIRVKLLSNFSGLNGGQITEMEFWGQYKD